MIGKWKNGSNKNSTNKNPGSKGFNAEFFKTFSEDLMSIFLELLNETEREGVLQNLLTEANMTLIQRQSRE